MKMILIQALGVLGAVLSIFAYQFKDNRKYFTILAFSGFCFGLHFYLLGAFTGALLNFINVIRGFGNTFEKNKKPYITLILTSVLYIAATVFTHGGALAILACAAQLVGSIGMFWGHETGCAFCNLRLFHRRGLSTISLCIPSAAYFAKSST